MYCTKFLKVKYKISFFIKNKSKKNRLIIKKGEIMQLQELEYKFSILPEDSKMYVMNYINSLYDSVINTNHDMIFNQNIKKISAKFLLTIDENERNKILSEQANKGKIIYENNPDLVFPDLVDDVIE